MTTRQLVILSQRGNHEVGNLNNLKVKTLSYGALCEEDIDNFTLVELDFNEDGERTCRQLTDVSKKSYLIATPEARYLGEEMVDFYNAKGERARIIILEEGYTRFDSSAFKLSDGIDEVKNGLKAHFDVQSKKFLIHDGTHADYNNAYAKFIVVSNEENIEYTLGKPMVRFEVYELGGSGEGGTP